jgi:hypothetical protein
VLLVSVAVALRRCGRLESSESDEDVVGRHTRGRAEPAFGARCDVPRPRVERLTDFDPVEHMTLDHLNEHVNTTRPRSQPAHRSHPRPYAAVFAGGVVNGVGYGATGRW